MVDRLQWNRVCGIATEALPSCITPLDIWTPPMTISRRACQTTPPRDQDQNSRRGVIAVFSAILMVIMLGMVAFAIDVGYVSNTQGEIQRAVDAGALAGAQVIGGGPPAAEPVAREYVMRNPTGADPIPDQNITVEFGSWDAIGRVFVEGAEPLSAIRVTALQPNRPHFFAPVLGETEFSVQASAIATYQPRDIVVVLDYSASMNDDSELKHIGQLGRSAVEANLRQIYNELGAPQYGSMTFTPQYIGSTDPVVVANQLGLSAVPYPYPSGSWNDYFRYVQTDRTLRNAGYANRYGYLTLINYWLQNQPKYSQTPDLWQTSEQPITAVKDALQVFLSYIQQSPTDDRVGLAIYTSEDGTGKLEQGLTMDMARIEQISRQRQAGHYDYFTNIGAGMQKAREELEDNGRPHAVKLIVLMTDGIANRPSSRTAARAYVNAEAQAAADANFPVATISLGANADTGLMQGVADATNGIHFNIPGGQTVAEYETDLEDAFREIAEFRPVTLVQ